MNLRDALRTQGVILGSEERLGGARHRIQFSCGKRKGSVVVSSPKEAFAAIITRRCEWIALDTGRPREDGTVVAEALLAQAYASEKESPE